MGWWTESGNRKRAREDDDGDGDDLENRISEEHLSKRQKGNNGSDDIAQVEKTNKQKRTVNERNVRRSDRVRLRRDLQDSWRGLGT